MSKDLTIALSRKTISVIGISILCTVLFAASLIFYQFPANAGISIDDMEPPHNVNGHPVSSIELNGDCEVLVCVTKYKIQYSYWGWRTSGNSERVAAMNSTTQTEPNATCNNHLELIGVAWT